MYRIEWEAKHLSEDERLLIRQSRSVPQLEGLRVWLDGHLLLVLPKWNLRERTNRTRYKTRDEARADIFDYIEVFYNRKRRHGYNGNVSPADFEGVSGGGVAPV